MTDNCALREPIRWPDNRTFAFSVFDDPDAQTLDGCRAVYDFLAGLGLLTTIGVWPCRPVREPNSPGETCGNDDYLAYVRDLQARGFEIGYHNTTPHSSFREEIAEGLRVFRGYFGHERPITMANHYNAEAIYWGCDRLSGSRRSLYRMLQPRNSSRFFGNMRGSAYFWGDVCEEHVQYCRNFVFPKINTLSVCPFMPYHDAEKPFVKYWYASSEGANVESFVRTLSEPNQDLLEQEGGACLMYAHFGHGFVRDGKLDARFRSLMTRLSKKNGWFVPAAALLDFLRQRNAGHIISPSERDSIEWRWLRRKLIRGTS
ncbi:MAG TPA: hypothetical protein VFA65_10550 [Bryobacteraceae bacterium]|nr:hypothetical protein [Bryobacteraceae bacterium]